MKRFESPLSASAATTRAQLKAAGFVDYTPPTSDVQELCQKCYTDSIGKKYFITATLFHCMSHPLTGEICYPDYEFDIQLYQRGTHRPADLKFFAGWSLADVEAYAENIWNLGGWDYYETWDEA